ncbi:MAG TPA: CBS domain-containing protein [Streptosporangiaceae bacterium]|nr:CBS domain-containing protein [Streptosporangiaceae bacterium]
MSRRDENLNAMLRHLGAAYYESLHGRASSADVARALDAVEEHNGDHPDPTGTARPARSSHLARKGPAGHHGRWHQRVRDVMTTKVITVDQGTPYKEIAALLAEHRISAVPVLILGRHVAGLVSEADLLSAQQKREQAAHAGTAAGLHLTHRHDAHHGLTAEELMTSPAVTIHPDASLPAAARLMNSHHLKRLLVVHPDGTLAGIVSRGDLLSVFLRSDHDIAAEVGELLGKVLLTDPEAITVRVRNGVVTLGGQFRPDSDTDPSLVRVAVRLTWDIDGVVDVIEKIGAPAPS